MLMALSMSAFAQFSAGCQTDSAKIAEYRERIGLDYSMPDYRIKKIDEKVMGWRLAKILEFLEKNYTQVLYNRMLSKIRSVQMNELKYRYLPVDKIKILNVQKQDSVISIKINTYTKRNKEKVDFDITLSFVNSLSDDETTNNLVVDIGRYINEDK